MELNGASQSTLSHSLNKQGSEEYLVRTRVAASHPPSQPSILPLLSHSRHPFCTGHRGEPVSMRKHPSTPLP